MNNFEKCIKEFSLEKKNIRFVPDFNKEYFVTRDGRIFSLKSKKFRELHPTVFNKYGHKIIGLFNKKYYYLQVHRLILLCFRGKPKGDKCFCRHLDGDGANNNLKNIRWGTRKENERDKVKHGRTNRGERNGMSKLKEADVIGIRKLAKSGKTQFKLGKLFGTNQQNISRIINKTRWKHT